MLRKFIAGPTARLDSNKIKDAVVIVTGANSGIGKATAWQLYAHGAHVVVACRSKEKAQDAISWIQSQPQTGTQGSLNYMNLNLQSLESVKEFATSVRKNYSQLDVLINNAGLTVSLASAAPYHPTLEVQAVTNYLSHFLLSELLIPDLTAARAAKDGNGISGRIVNVSSDANKAFFMPSNALLKQQDKQVVDFERFFSYNAQHPYFGKREYGGTGSMEQYVFTKFCQVLYTKYLHRVHNQNATVIDVNALHPGVVSTNFFRLATPFMQSIINNVVKPFMKSELDGAQTSLYLAADVPQGTSGQYWNRNKVEHGNKLANDKDLQDELYRVSKNLVKDYL